MPLRLALVSTICAAVVTALRANHTPSRVFEAKETRLYLLFYAGMIAGIPFSVYRPGSFETIVLRYTAHVVYFVVFVIHVNSTARLRRVSAIVMATVFGVTMLALKNGSIVDGRFVIEGGMYDPNDIAFVEVALLAFPLWVLTSRFGVALKALSVASVLGGILLVLYTASRGGLFGVLAFLGLFLILRTKPVGKAFKLVTITVLVVAAAANIDKINVDRYMTVTSIQDDYNFHEGGRVSIWKRGWKLFLASPLTGVGVDGFGKAVGDMRSEEGVLPEWQTAHSTYVLVLTETGLLGTIPFVLLLAHCLVSFNRLRRHPERLNDELLKSLPGLLLIGFSAQLVAGAFLSQTYSMFFTLPFALAAVLNRLAACGSEAIPAVPPASANIRAVPFRPRSRGGVYAPFPS